MTMHLLGQYMTQAFWAIGILSALLVVENKRQILKGEMFSMLCINSNFTGNYVELSITTGSGSDDIIAKHDTVNGNEAEILVSTYNGRLNFIKSNVVISDVQISDDGLYRCTDKGIDGSEIKLETELQVLVRPKITVGLTNTPLKSGSSLMKAAECKASDAWPPAQVRWTSDRHLDFNVTKVENSGNYPAVYNTTAALYILPTNFFDKQPFICTVIHPSLEMGANSTTIYLNVQYSPSKPIIEVINQSTLVRCKADGNPTPVITWTILAGSPVVRPASGESVIRLISPHKSVHHNDTYIICHAKNGIKPDTSVNITASEAIPQYKVLGHADDWMFRGIVIGVNLILALLFFGLFVWSMNRKKDKKKIASETKGDVCEPSQDSQI